MDMKYGGEQRFISKREKSNNISYDSKLFGQLTVLKKKLKKTVLRMFFNRKTKKIFQKVFLNYKGKKFIY